MTEDVRGAAKFQKLKKRRGSGALFLIKRGGVGDALRIAPGQRAVLTSRKPGRRHVTDRSSPPRYCPGSGGVRKTE